LLPQPKGPVLLVVTGDITRANGPDRASFDLDMLKQIGLTSLVTATPWTEGTSRFEGVLARDLLNYVGARGDHITAISMNNYLVEIPIKDFVDHDVIFALKGNGKYLGVRDMGPVLIVYPSIATPRCGPKASSRAAFCNWARSMWESPVRRRSPRYCRRSNAD